MTNGMKSGSGEDPFEDLETNDDENRDANTGEPSEDVESEETEGEEWVRVQFRVPEGIRTDLNEIGYAKLMMELRERGIEGKEKRELQHAAVQMLLDNPDVWADTVEELDDP